MAQVPTAQPTSTELRIVAIVNDEVITSLDVADRVAFVVATTNLPRTRDTMQRLIPQVSRQLVDEALQLQEAKRLGIHPDKAEILEAIDELGSRRGLSRQELYAELAGKGVSEDTFHKQIEAQLAWQKVIARRIRPEVNVSEAEVERTRLMDSLKLTAEGSIEVQIVSLVLPVSKPEDDANVSALAAELVDDLRQGATFEEVAAQFGDGSVPEPNWAPLSDLAPNLATTLKNAIPGSVSDPARTLDGYVIIKLLGRRGISSAEVNDSTLLLKDILLKLDTDDEAEAAELSLIIAREVARNPGSCRTEGVDGIDGLEDLDIDVNFIEAQFSELSNTVQNIVSKLIVGNVSEPFAGPDGMRIMMLCERADTPPQRASAEETYSKLTNKRMGLEAQKYMRNLRRDSFIEFRR